MYGIERLARRHDRNVFSCGVKALDDYLKLFALQNDKKRIATAYAMLESKRVIGYYTLSNASVTLSDLPESISKNLPAYPVPGSRIGRFAVDQNFHGQGIGERLLSDALIRIVEASRLSASFVVLVDAKEQSTGFYRKYGFVPLKQNSLTLFVPVKTISEAVGTR